MKFVARHASFEQIDGVSIFALADESGRVSANPKTYVILSFGDEDEQDRSLGLVGLHIETGPDNHSGYGLVRDVTYDGQTISIHCEGDRTIHATIDTDMMSDEEIRTAVEQCNSANGSKSGRESMR